MNRIVKVFIMAALLWYGISAVVAAKPAAAAVQIFTSPAGSGTACTLSAPCSLSTAQATAESDTSGQAADVAVGMLPGTYRFRQPLTFTDADSGQNGHTVTYAGYDGAKPILTSASQITGWSVYDRSRNIWSAPIPASLNTRELWVDGFRAPIAEGVPPTSLSQTSSGYTESSQAMDAWGNQSGIEFVYPRGNGNWTQTRCRVASVSAGTVTMQQPCWGNSTVHGALAGDGGNFPALHAVPTRVENAYELLKTPGQWYLDTTAHRLYYIPLPGQDVPSLDIEAPSYDGPIVQGTGSTSSPVANMTFSGIQFSYSTWLAPSGPDGYSDIQAGHYLTGANAGTTQGICNHAAGGTCPYGDWPATPAAVDFAVADHVSFTGDTFNHLGSAGLSLGEGSQGNLVQGNEFTDISSAGIDLGSVTDPGQSDPAQQTANDTITDNWIHDIGVEYADNAGIFAGYSVNTVISHNQLNDLPYDGIDFGWGGWYTNADNQTSETNYSASNQISDNFVFDYKRLLNDGGGIYTNGRQGSSQSTGLVESGNVVFGQYAGYSPFYPDRGSDYITYSNNIGLSPSPGVGGCNPVGNVTGGGNYFSVAPFGQECDITAVNTSTLDYTLIANPPGAADFGAGPGSPAAIVASAGLEPGYQYLAENAGPQVFTSTPNTGQATSPTQVLISGSGFTATSDVSFGTAPASSVTLLSPNFLVATSPAGSALSQLRVTSGQPFSTALDDAGESSDSAPATGSLDGNGYSFSAQALAAAGLAPGATFTHSGVTFTLPASSGPSDVLADGQTVAVSGHGSILGFLCTGVSYAAPTVSGTVTVNYADGTSQPYSMTVPNWYGSAAPGYDAAATMSYRNSPSGKDTYPATMYQVNVGVTDKTVVSVTLPRGSSLHGIHIFAIAVADPLTPSFDNVGITSDSDTAPGNIDGNGYSFSAPALTAAGYAPGVTFRHSGFAYTPSALAGVASDVEAQGQALPLTGSTQAIGMLVTGINYAGGTTSGSGTVNYTDGTHSAYTITVPNWYGDPVSGYDAALSTPYRNGPHGRDSAEVNIYQVVIAANGAKTLASVTLPSGGTAASGLRVFAISPQDYAAGFGSALDTTSVTDDSSPGAGTADGGVGSFSAQAMTAAGAAPGTSYDFSGFTYPLPANILGQPDSVRAEGQTIAVSGGGSKLGLLVSAGTYNSSVSGPVTVIYNDGSTATTAVTVPNWYGSPSSGYTGAIVSSYRNLPSGRDSHPVTIYQVTIPLAAGKTVSAVQ